MNTSPNAKRILCFGDSNTFGVQPYDPAIGRARWDSQTRWTGVMQELLGSEYEVIEQGVGGRTTIYQNPNLNFPTKGNEYLNALLHSVGEIDLLVFMLGTNDCQVVFDVTAEQIVNNVIEMISSVQNEGRDKGVDKILVLAPPSINEDTQYQSGSKNWVGSAIKIAQVEQLLQQSCSGRENEGVFFMTISDLVEPDDGDGIHLNAISHKILGTSLSQKVKEILE